MGLLRKAAVTADRGVTGTTGPTAAPAAKAAGARVRTASKKHPGPAGGGAS